MLKKIKLTKEMILALAFAGLAAFIAFVYFSNLQREYKTMADPVKVVAAKERIAQGVTIRPEHLEEIFVPKQYVGPKAFTSLEQIFDPKTKAVFVTLTPIEKGEQLLATKVSKPSDITGIANIIPDGLRAFPVNFDDKNLQVLTPGAHIDVLAVFQYADKNKNVHEIVYVAAQDILVLAVGDDFLGVARKKTEENLANRANVTLALTLEQAEIIMLIKQNGALKYAIRPAGDAEIIEGKNIRISDIIKDANSSNVASGNPALDQSKKEIMDLLSKYGK